MKRYFLALLLISWLQLLYAEVTVETDHQQVQLGETFRLILTTKGQNTSGVPNIQPLQKDFTIVGTERSMTYSVVNGKTESLNQWIIVLSANKTGIFSIPSLQIGTERSPPLRIEVTANKLSRGAAQPDVVPNDAVLLQTEVNPKSGAYVNQQLLYTVKLYNSEQLMDAEYQPPRVEDALIVPLGDSQRSEAILNGHRYVVEEQQYAIFPQKSGELVIYPPSFSALIFDAVPRRVNVHDDATKLIVKPMPAKYSGNYWLPAKQVALTEMYDQLNTSLTQGSTIVRKVTLQAAGIPAQLLPTLSFPSNPQFSVYPEKAELSNGARQHDLVSRMEVKVTYLLNQPGQITIPALQVPWFNTDTGKEELATLPERRLTVVAKGGSQSNAMVPPPSVQGFQEKPTPLATVEKVGDHSMVSFWSAFWWVALGFVLAVLILVIIVGWYNTSQRMGRRKRVMLKKIQQSCRSNNPELTETLLLRWSTLQWPELDILSLQQLAKQLHDVSLKKQLSLLSEVRYSKERSKQWQGMALWQCFADYLRSKPTKKSKSPKLPPINPIG